MKTALPPDAAISRSPSQGAVFDCQGCGACCSYAADWPRFSTEDDEQPGEPLLELVMKDGQRVRPPEPLDAIRKRAARELARLPEPLRRLEPGPTYPVKVSEKLRQLTAEVDSRLAGQMQE